MSLSGSSSGRYPSLFGSHEVVRVVAKGGMGAVFEVKSRHSGARAAAKTILNAKDAGARERFRREAELLARCDRIRGIVKVHSFGEQPDGTLYMILDFVDGPSLDKLLAQKSKLGPVEAARIVRDVARALGAIHAMGIVHRDVKPGNVLVDAQGQPWLTDFGLAAARDMERLTRTGSFVGTVTYCSPEQAASTPCGPPSDVFSLGCVLFQALAGEPPIVADSTVEHMARLASSEALRDVREVEKRVPRSLASIVARALVKDSQSRYLNGEELAKDLDRFLAGESVEGLSAVTRRRSLSVLAVAALLLVVGVIAAYRAQVARMESALEEARAETEHARSIVSHGGDLDEARRAVAAAREALARGSRGAPVTLAALASSVLGASGEVAAAQAQRALARGTPGEALRLLESETVLPFEGDLVRARALLALGRGAEGIGVLAEDAIAKQPRARHAEAWEVLGDLCAGGDDARAERAYTAAEQAGRKTPELRAKRAGAAAGAGHDAVALADFRALVPDLEKLAPERAGNAAFARIAPALYRHGLANKDDRLLEAAWRIAAPPRELEPALVERWMATAVADASAWSDSFLASFRAGEAEIWKLRPILQRAQRLRSKPLDLYHAGFSSALQLVRGWSKNGDLESVERIAAAFLLDWPKHPLFLFIQAWSNRRVEDRWEKSCALLTEAIDQLPPEEPDEDPEVRRLASQCAFYLVECTENAKREHDMARLQRATDRGRFAEAWLWLARAHGSRGERDKAAAALAEAERRPMSSGGSIRPGELEAERIQLLIESGERDEAHRRAKALANRADGHIEGSRMLFRLEAWEDIVAALDAARVDEQEPLIYYSVSLARVGRAADSERAVARIERRWPEKAAEVRGIIERLGRREAK